MRKMVTSIRLSQDTLHHLKELGHRESLKRKVDVTWAALVREAIQKHLLNGSSSEPDNTTDPTLPEPVSCRDGTTSSNLQKPSILL